MAGRPLYVLKHKSKSVYDRLCLDEALFRDKLKRTWLVVDDVSVVRDEVAVVLGLSGKLNELVHEDEARGDGVKLIRRFTGGGTVSVDRNAFLVTLVANASEIPPFLGIPIKPYPREIMRWTDEAVFRPAFDDVKISPLTTFSARENDYVLDHQYKVGGNAQGISNDRFCHHTSFLWQVNAEVMRYLKMPNKRPQYREDREHDEFLKGLEGSIKSKEVFNDAIISRFARAISAYETVFEVIPPTVLPESRNIYV